MYPGGLLPGKLGTTLDFLFSLKVQVLRLGPRGIRACFNLSPRKPEPYFQSQMLADYGIISLDAEHLGIISHPKTVEEREGLWHQYF